MISNVAQALNSEGLEICALPDWVCQVGHHQTWWIWTNQNGGYGGQRAMKNGDVVSFTRFNQPKFWGISAKWMLKGSKNGGKWWTNESRESVLGLAIIHLPKCGLSNTSLNNNLTYFAKDFYDFFLGCLRTELPNWYPKFWSFQLDSIGGFMEGSHETVGFRFEDSKKSSHWNR